MPGEMQQAWSAEVARASAPWSDSGRMLLETHRTPASPLFFLAGAVQHPYCSKQDELHYQREYSREYFRSVVGIESV